MLATIGIEWCWYLGTHPPKYEQIAVDNDAQYQGFAEAIPMNVAVTLKNRPIHYVGRVIHTRRTLAA